MFIEIDGQEVKVDLHRLKKEFPNYAHLMDKPMRFMLNPMLFKIDPDGNSEPMVRRRHGILTRFNYSDANTGEPHRFAYYETRQPDRVNPLREIKKPNHVFLERGVLEIDPRPIGTKVNLAKIYLLLRCPHFGNEIYLEDTQAIATKSIKMNEEVFNAWKMLMDPTSTNYIKDADLKDAAYQLKYTGVEGLSPAEIRRNLISQASSNPAKFRTFLGTKNAQIIGLITECQELKVLHYNMTQKKWFKTSIVDDGESIICSRVMSDEIIKATSAQSSVEELAKHIIERATELQEQLNTLLSEEQIRSSRVSELTGVEIDEIYKTIQVVKAIPSPTMQ